MYCYTYFLLRNVIKQHFYDLLHNVLEKKHEKKNYSCINVMMYRGMNLLKSRIMRCIKM